MLKQCKSPFIDAVGFTVFLATGVDLSDASSVYIRYTKPDDTNGFWPAIAGSTLDGNNLVFGLSYDTVLDDLDQSGDWKLQPYVVGLDGFTGDACIGSMHVSERLAGANPP